MVESVYLPKRSMINIPKGHETLSNLTDLPLENYQTFFLVEVLMVVHHLIGEVVGSSLVAFLVESDLFFSDRIDQILISLVLHP